MKIELRAFIRYWAVVVLMGALWLLALTYGSGIGMAYGVYGKAKLLTLIAFAWQFIFRRRFRVVYREMAYTLFFVMTWCAISLIFYGQDNTDYLWVYLLIPLMSRLSLTRSQMKWISLMYGALGGAVLWLTKYGTVFRGWNQNSIAMLAFFSYTVFAASYTEAKDWKRVCFFAYSGIYFLWLNDLGSRGSTLFSMILLAGNISLVPLRRLVRRKRVLWLLLFPLLTAIAVAAVHGLPFVSRMNVWSMQRFHKPLFNGRDTLWLQGFRLLGEHPFLGNGNLGAGNWHNSAVTCLVGAGCVGYLVWLFGIRKILNMADNSDHDSLIYGLKAAFAVIWLQQTIELGLIAPQANVIPYAVLGLLLARANTVAEESTRGTIDHSSRI